MIKKTLTLSNKLGLHARASAKLVNVASQYASKISICKRDQLVSAKNIMDVMLLAATQHTPLQFIIEGEDEEEALTALETLINQRFYEEETI